MLLKSVANKQDNRPFFLTLALFALSYAGLGVSMFPYIVPQSITIWQAAAPDISLNFMIVRCRHPGADHSDLHWLGLLGVSRQGPR